MATKPGSESTFRILSAEGGFCDPLVIKPIKRSVINIQRSMLDVRCSTFKLLTASAWRILEQDMGYKIKPLASEEAQAAYRSFIREVLSSQLQVHDYGLNNPEP